VRLAGLALALLVAGCAAPGPPMSLKSYIGITRAATHYLDSAERTNCRRQPPSDLCQEGKDLRAALQPIDAMMLDGYEKQANAKTMSERMDRAVEVLLKVLGLATKAVIP
jgi:hypothetical protein